MPLERDSRLRALRLQPAAIVSTAPYLYSLQDSVMVLAAGGWTSVDLRFSKVGDQLRLLELTAQGNAAKAPTPKPTLHIDPKSEAERLSEGLTELHGVLQQSGKHVSFETMRVERTPDFCDWKSLKPDGSVEWFARLSKTELDSLLMTDALFQALTGTERAFDDLQRRFAEQVGRTSTTTMVEPGLVRVNSEKGPLHFRAEVIGQYWLDSFQWVWSWAHEENKAHAARVHRVCNPEIPGPGLSALWRPTFHCDETLAWALAGHVVVATGARGLVRSHVEDAQAAVLFAVFEPRFDA